MEGRRKKNEHFLFPELETMRIHVQDLTGNPELFRIDLQEHKIYVSQAGRSSYQAGYLPRIQRRSFIRYIALFFHTNTRLATIPMTRIAAIITIREGTDGGVPAFPSPPFSIFRSGS